MRYIALIAVVFALAACGGSSPTTTAPTATPSATPVAQSYPDVQSLLAAMAAHDAACSDVSIKTGSTVNGALSTFAECSGASSGDTAVVMFTDHASAVAYANAQLNLSQSASLGPAAEVVGPDWTVNTVPAFAAKVVKAIGGQLITAPAAASSPTQTPASTPSQSTFNLAWGTSVTVSDSSTGASWDVTVLSVKPYSPSPDDTAPNAGEHYVIATVSYSATTGPVDYNEFDWTIQSPSGLSSQPNLMLNQPNSLQSGTLQSGGKLEGTVVAQVPDGDGGTVVYAPGGNQQASWAFSVHAVG